MTSTSLFHSNAYNRGFEDGKLAQKEATKNPVAYMYEWTRKNGDRYQTVQISKYRPENNKDVLVNIIPLYRA